jgi:hypothetical protein
VIGSFSERLALWHELVRQSSGNATRTDEVEKITTQARSLRKIRNSIVHGLVGGNSMPASGPGYIECAVGGYDRPTGKTVQYSIDDLEHLAQAADACRRGFRHSGSFNYLLDSRFDDTSPV